MKILLADDHPLLVEGLSNLLAAHGFNVVGQAGNGMDAVRLAAELRPDLVLMDIRMPMLDGLSATRQIKASQPGTNIVMLTTSADDSDLFEAIKSGALGYLLKSISGSALVEALTGLEQGVPPFSPGLAMRLLREFSAPSPAASHQNSAPDDALTDRQLEVLKLVSAGLTCKEVGKRLSISERTVRFHMTEVMARLHLQNRSQVLTWAGMQGFRAVGAKREND